MRKDCAMALRKTKPPRRNSPKVEILAYNNFMHHNDLIISKANKGNATVIMSMKDYISKILDLLIDTNSYGILPHNPCSKIINKVKSILSSSSFDDVVKKCLLPIEDVTPCIYGVPKVNKEDIPLQPTINTMGSPTYNLASFLTKLISLLLGKSKSFVKDSTVNFVQFIKDTRLESNNILVSFYVVSLFTKFPILDAMKIIKCKLNFEITSLVELCLRSTFFSFQGVIYEQVDGVAMGSPLSPIIANIYMEHFEEMVLQSSPIKPRWWKIYVGDTNVCWPHGLNKLEFFHKHINRIVPYISFTIELESSTQLPFLDVFLIKHPNGTLSHRVFHKATHTDLYIHSSSHHHPIQKVGILKILTLRAYRICDDENLNQEISHLRHVFQLNGYSHKQIWRALNHVESFFLSTSNINSSQPSPLPSGSLPFIEGISQEISKILTKKFLRCAFKPLLMLKNRMPPLKDPKDTLLDSRVYKVVCCCGAPYIGETSLSFNTRIKECSVHIKHDRVHKLALAENSSSTKHYISLENTLILFKEDNYYKIKLKEAIEIYKHPSNLNHDEGWNHIPSWHPLLSS